VLSALYVSGWGRQFNIESGRAWTKSSLYRVEIAKSAVPLGATEIQVLYKAMNIEEYVSLLYLNKFLPTYRKHYRLNWDAWWQDYVNWQISARSNWILRYWRQGLAIWNQLCPSSDLPYACGSLPIVLDRWPNPKELNFVWIRLKIWNWTNLHHYPSTFTVNQSLNARLGSGAGVLCGFSRNFRCFRLALDDPQRAQGNPNCPDPDSDKSPIRPNG